MQGSADDERRIDVVAYNLFVFGGVPVCADATLVSVLHKDGSAWRGAADTDGVRSRAARKRKEVVYPELVNGDSGRLVYLGCEAGGRWAPETLRLLSQLAREPSKQASAVLRYASPVVAPCQRGSPDSTGSIARGTRRAANGMPRIRRSRGRRSLDCMEERARVQQTACALTRAAQSVAKRECGGWRRKQKKQTKKQKKAREARGAREAREARGAEEAKEAREAMEARKAREVREAREAEKAKGAREAMEAREAREARGAREAKEAKGASWLPWVSWLPWLSSLAPPELLPGPSLFLAPWLLPASFLTGEGARR